MFSSLTVVCERGEERELRDFQNLINGCTYHRAEFKEQMGIFKLCYEKPFLEAHKEAQMEKRTELLQKRAAQRTALREKRKQGLLPKKKKTLYEQEQDRYRQRRFAIWNLFRFFVFFSHPSTFLATRLFAISSIPGSGSLRKCHGRRN